MLTAQLQQRIEAEVQKYNVRQAALPEALRLVQEEHGWISDEAVADIAECLRLSPAEVDSIATFYSGIYRRSVGRHVILVCNSVSCWVMGYNIIRAHIEEKLHIALGETTADNRFTLLPVVCLGDCDHAPAMMVDKDLYGSLTPETIDELLDRYA